MGERRRWVLVGAAASLLLSAPLGAQTVPVHGRVEDALWRQPLAGVRVFAADSSASTLTDSLGAFVLPMAPGGPFAVVAERLGYRSLRFDLGAEAPARRSVLLLEIEPVELEGIDVVGESEVTQVLRVLRRRRNAYFGPVSAFDRTYLERMGRGGTVWDFVRMRTMQVYPCDTFASGLCTTERGRRSLRFGPLELQVRVCVDGRESWGAVGEMSSMELESVSLIEMFNHGRGSIRIYTPGYLTSGARAGREGRLPADLGC